MTSSKLTPHSVQAYNLSHASENKIHDDAVAKKLGFTGGLVPGVEVYAYMTHMAVARWGRDWLQRGSMECRFQKPVYDGRTATVTAEPTDAGLTLAVTSDGAACASGTATLRPDVDQVPTPADYPSRKPPALTARPPADEASLAIGSLLSTEPAIMTGETARQYLADVREKLPLYAEQGLVHPGQILRLCNGALRDNVLLAPWIHVGSLVTNFSPARVGDRLEARARVVANFDSKGHRLVRLDTLILANGATPVAHVEHSAIYRLRHLSAA